MNRAYDYNGFQVAPSRPVQKLVKRTRILHIDSRDRDVALYPNNGSFTLYLPRTYERVTSINIKDAEFPANNVADTWDFLLPPVTPVTPGVNPYPGADAAVNPLTSATGLPGYFFMEIRGLNMSDETAAGADRAALTNSVFAKFVSVVNTEPIIYNESSNAHQTIQFYPPLTKMDRFEIKLRTHGMPSTQYMYWAGLNWSMSLEIETLENSFDDFSTLETRIATRE